MSFDFLKTGSVIPDGWKLKYVRDVADVNALTIKKNNQPDEINYIDISSVSSGLFEKPKYMLYSEAPSRAKRILRKNDFIISTVRPNLKQYALLETVGNNWVASTGFCVVSTKDPLASWYLYSFITSDLFNEHLVRVADGAAYPAFNSREIEDALIPWPDKKNLYSINQFAKALDNKIQLNRQTNQTLEQIAQALFKSWFIDFEPVKAKIAAKQALDTDHESEKNVKKGGVSINNSEKEEHPDVTRAAMCAISGKTLEELEQLPPDTQQQLKTTAALFPDALVESELGEIPEGWEVVRFKQIIEKYIDNRGKTPPLVEEGIPLIEVKHLPENSLKPNLNTVKRVDNETYENWFRSHLEVDDIIISTVGTIGRICMVPDTEKFVIAQNLLGIRFDRKSVSPYFMYYQMDSFRFRHDLDARLVITVQASIKRKDLETIDLLSPPVALQNKFENFIKPFVEKQQSDIEIELAELRDSLLPKLLAGELL